MNEDGLFVYVVLAKYGYGSYNVEGVFLHWKKAEALSYELEQKDYYVQVDRFEVDTQPCKT